MFTCTTFHHTVVEARKAEPGMLDLYTFYHPIHLSYHQNYVGWKLADTTYHGATLALELLWVELEKSMKKWDIKIQNVYDDSTARYRDLFPIGRSGFNELEYNQKLVALETFIGVIGDDADEDMRDVKTQAGEILARITAARKLQGTKKNLKDELARQVDIARLVCAQGLYRNQGELMKLFYLNPILIEPFFDIESMTRPKPDEDEPEEGLVLTLAPGQTIEAGIGITDRMVLSLTNHGEVPLSLWAGGDTNVPPLNPYVLAAGAEAEVAIADLGPAGSRYLYIMNANPDLPGAIEIIDVTPVEE